MKKFLSLVVIGVLILCHETIVNAIDLPEVLEATDVITRANYPDINIRGRLHLDAGFHDEDNVNFGDGFNTRRSRIGLSGDLNPDWSFIIEYDFSEEDISANDVMLTRGIGGGLLKIGNFKVPMGLNELTSSTHYTFIERASNSNIIVDSRRIGVGFDYRADYYGVQTMIYGRETGGRENGDMPVGMGARSYINPVCNDDWMVHLGLSAAFENRRDYDTLQFRDRPEARVDPDIRLIDTGLIADVNATIKTGIELAFQYGPLSLETEYLMVNIDNADDPRFDGYHIQASYILTGESRGYEKGVFRGVTPENRTWGAWETAIRWSSIDLNDANINGGKQENLTLGVNYYVRENIRFMANCVFADVTGSGAEAGGDTVGDDSPVIYSIRAQYNF